MKKPTKILSEEHKNILSVIDALNKECGALKSGEDLNIDFFEKTIDFIRNYADKFHHAKEEDILFIELGKDSVQLPCNPIPQMLHEHNLGRQFVKGIEEGLIEKNKEKVIENAEGYGQLLREHIYKEDSILYPMADEALTESVQELMLIKFEEVENKKFGSAVKKKYLLIVEELTN